MKTPIEEIHATKIRLEVERRDAVKKVESLNSALKLIRLEEASRYETYFRQAADEILDAQTYHKIRVRAQQMSQTRNPKEK